MNLTKLVIKNSEQIFSSQKNHRSTKCSQNIK